MLWCGVTGKLGSMRPDVRSSVWLSFLIYEIIGHKESEMSGMYEALMKC